MQTSWLIEAKLEGGQLEEDQLISPSPMYEATLLQRETEEIVQELERVLLRLQPMVRGGATPGQDQSDESRD